MIVKDVRAGHAHWPIKIPKKPLLEGFKDFLRTVVWNGNQRMDDAFLQEIDGWMHQGSLRCDDASRLTLSRVEGGRRKTLLSKPECRDLIATFASQTKPGS